jgi:hypothetical protein
MAVTGTLRIDHQFAVGVWTNTTADTIAVDGLRFRRGMMAGGPLDRVAATGTLEYSLQNDSRNSGGLVGYYSPGHANCRTGWTFGIPVRVVFTYISTDYPLWRGRVRTISPDPGTFGLRRVHVTAQDAMGDIAGSVIREIAPQLNKTEVELLQAIIAALHADAQPPATSYDDALDAYPFALDNAGSGASAVALATDVMNSAVGYLFGKNDGTVRYTNRQTWVSATSSSTLTESDIVEELVVPSSRANVYNEVRVTAHPKAVDDTSDTVLWSSDSIIVVPQSATTTIWATYSDPDNANQLIGATDVQPVPVANTDYMANAAPTGLGTDLTADVTIAVTGFASTAKIEITNASATNAYLVNASGEPFLQIKGRGVYDFAPITAESYTAAAYADRTLTVDMPYQDDGNIAQGVADLLKSQWQSTTRKVESLQINPHKSNGLMLAALQREIGERITVSETVTGLSSVVCQIVGVEFEARAPNWLRCRWVLAPALTQNFFTLNTDTLNSAATLGYV